MVLFDMIKSTFIHFIQLHKTCMDRYKSGQQSLQMTTEQIVWSTRTTCFSATSGSEQWTA